jgi:hypothetical protein
VDNLRTGRFKQEILDLKFVVRCSAVVLAELSRAARSRPMRSFVDDLAKNLRIIAIVAADPVIGPDSVIVTQIGLIPFSCPFYPPYGANESQKRVHSSDRAV